MTAEPQHSTSMARGLAIVAALTLVLAVAVRVAWLGDDAYITLRSVENWASGNGLRWNPTDRVQTYTHPLWMLLLSAGRWLSGGVYFTTLAISLALSTVAVAWLLLRARNVAAVVGTASALVCARAFPEYMTSGLETPLTFVLLVAFVANACSRQEPARRYSIAVLLTGLLAFNRMDLGVLCLPATIAAMRGVPFASIVKRGLLMSLPFVGWLLFAGIYYGSPLPVTAHAKAFGVGIPSSELSHQGLLYLLHALRTDPTLALVTGLGALLLLVGNRTRWLAFGALCYLAYVVKVGGGFMQGRFLLPPFVVVVAGLGGWFARVPQRRSWWLAAVAVALMLVGGLPTWMRAPSADQPASPQQLEDQHGIVDERCMYYSQLGLLAPTRAIPEFGALERTAFPQGRERRWLLLNGAVGSAGFGAGSRGHVVDPLLCDPLVARLPARDPRHWRIGHVLRRIPEGYWESLRDRQNHIHHPGLRDYYGALRVLTQEPVFDGQRLQTLLRMALGAYDDGFRAFVDEHYYRPPRIEVAAAQLAEPLPVGCFWFDEPRVRLVYEGGLAVPFGEAVTARTLQVQILGTYVNYRIRFVQAGEVYGEATCANWRVEGTAPPPVPSPMRMVAGLHTVPVSVPEQVPQFDTLWIDFVEIPDSDKAPGPSGIGAVIVGG